MESEFVWHFLYKTMYIITKKKKVDGMCMAYIILENKECRPHTPES
jgi:hypothetical protein